ncbi:MAG: hypothetical protein S0880_36810 [Actinomycetota bacterium]|nr:hypothetical protein [Actinomycetota bacterium]
MAVVPAGVRAVIERRLARLRPLTRQVLRVAGVWGGEVDVPVLASIVEVGCDAVAGALDEARAARLVSVGAGGRSAGLIHALVGEVLVEEVSTSQRRELHRRVARTIEAAGDPARVGEAAHHALAGASGDDIGWAVDLAARAAGRAMAVLAYEEAAVWCERALEVLRFEAPRDAAEAPLLMSFGEARLASGEVEAARAAFERVAAIARRRGDGELLADAALGFGLGFGAIEVQWLDPVQVELLTEALDALGPEPSPRRVWVLARLSVALSFMDEEERRVALAEEAEAMARVLDDRRALGYALAARCDAWSGPDHCRERAEDAAEVVATGLASGDLRLEALGRRLRVVALWELGEVAAADVEIAAFGRIAERLRQPRYQWYVPLWQGRGR